MRDRLADLVARLRAAGVPVGVGEILDAHEAVALVGFGRLSLREGLAATLVKDHAFRETFDVAFDAVFPLVPADRRCEAPSEAVAPSAVGASGPVGTGGPGRPEPEVAEPRSDARGAIERERAAGGGRWREPMRPPGGKATQEGEEAERVEPSAHGPRTASRQPGPDAAARSAARMAREAALARTPFRDIGPEAGPEVDSLVRELARRLRRRWSRRLRPARRGTLDVRRTLRRAASRGGVPVEILRRKRRSSRPDLVALVDVSWSVQRAAATLLGLLTPSLRFFRRVDLLGYVDAPVRISFERGHLVPHGPLDLGAPSDFGRVLGLLVAEPPRLTRQTLLLVAGDARNNGRPARAADLGAIRARVGFAAWLVPEPVGRWGTGDSDLHRYARHVDALLGAADIRSLERALERLPVRR